MGGDQRAKSQAFQLPLLQLFTHLYGRHAGDGTGAQKRRVPADAQCGAACPVAQPLLFVWGVYRTR